MTIQQNNGYVKTSYNTAIAESYYRGIKRLIRKYYTLVSDDALESFIATGDFAELTAYELLAKSGFDILSLEKEKEQLAYNFVKSIELQANANFRRGYKEAQKPLPKPLIEVRKFNQNSKNLITQQIKKIGGIENYQYSRIDEALQEIIATGGSLRDFKVSLRSAALFNEKRIRTIAKNQLTFATTVVYKNKAEELGLNNAAWQHPPASIYKTKPRPHHVAANGRKFKLSKGCRIKNEKGKYEYILPGEKPNCECSYIIII